MGKMRLTLVAGRAAGVLLLADPLQSRGGLVMSNASWIVRIWGVARRPASALLATDDPARRWVLRCGMICCRRGEKSAASNTAVIQASLAGSFGAEIGVCMGV